VTALRNWKKAFSTSDNTSRKFSYKILVGAVGAYYPETLYEICMLVDPISWFDYILKAVRNASIDEAVLITVARSHNPLYTGFFLNLGENDALTERVLLAATENENTYAADFIALV
jgi:hypothetical protein